MINLKLNFKQGNKPKKDQINRKPHESKILEKTSIEKSKSINPAQDNAKTENVSREREEKPLLIVAGDSIVEGLRGWLMSRRANVKYFLSLVLVLPTWNVLSSR